MLLSDVVPVKKQDQDEGLHTDEDSSTRLEESKTSDE
uniref:Uncharacterized protein n=1 Tax=Peronospora matthiolae TaxID=2874970 RepID=A0AAV1UEK9_9STRA